MWPMQMCYPLSRSRLGGILYKYCIVYKRDYYKAILKDVLTNRNWNTNLWGKLNELHWINFQNKNLSNLWFLNETLPGFYFWKLIQWSSFNLFKDYLSSEIYHTYWSFHQIDQFLNELLPCTNDKRPSQILANLIYKTLLGHWFFSFSFPFFIFWI